MSVPQTPNECLRESAVQAIVAHFDGCRFQAAEAVASIRKLERDEATDKLTDLCGGSIDLRSNVQRRLAEIINLLKVIYPEGKRYG